MQTRSCPSKLLEGVADMISWKEFSEGTLYAKCLFKCPEPLGSDHILMLTYSFPWILMVCANSLVGTYCEGQNAYRSRLEVTLEKFPLWYSRLRIQRSLCSGPGHCWGWDSIPSPAQSCGSEDPGLQRPWRRSQLQLAFDPRPRNSIRQGCSPKKRVTSDVKYVSNYRR